MSASLKFTTIRHHECPACDSQGEQHERHLFDGAEIVICRACGLQWTEILPDGTVKKPTTAIFHSTYIQGDEINFGNYEPFVSFFEELDQRFAGPVRILDIGCGSGHFIAECLKRGHDAWGVEIETERATRMTQEVRERVLFQSADQLPGFPVPFQAVTFWDSFEHLQQPFEVIEPLRRSITTGGTVFIRVNNTRDIFNWISLALLRAWPGLGRPLFKACYSLPEHFWNFSRRPMAKLCAQSNWSIVKFRATETPSRRFTKNLLVRAAIEGAYLINRLIGGGKIGEYWLVDNKID